tara:strand:+ start:185 stop:463 length:279 start_codon:yes stop_codon:yes gene_type:complete
MTVILDPTDEKLPVERGLAKRTGKINGRLALLDISKPRGNVFLDRLAELIRLRLPDLQINRYAKPTFTRPAPEELRFEMLRENDFVVEGLAD